MTLPVRQALFVAFILLVFSAGLYLPWRDNPLIFDDTNLLQTTGLMDYAVTPINATPRQFPYFTLGFEHVMSGGNLHVSRYVNMVLHALSGFALFLLFQRLLALVQSQRRATLTAAAMALVFVVHPIAVYATGYLIQRTILFATLFTLLSAWQFDKALANSSRKQALWAGLLYACAVFSKEHAVSGAIAVLGLCALRHSSGWRKTLEVCSAFLAIALPCAVWVVLGKLGLLARAYEPDASMMIGNAGSLSASSWAVSAALQSLFFFRYFLFWLWPQPTGLSIDIRPDLESLSQFPAILLGPIAFTLVGIVVAWVLGFKKASMPVKLGAYGLLWAMGLFLVELSSVRVQEPIVLYRSYLWAPGFLLCVAVVATWMQPKLFYALAAAAVLALCPLAWGRLGTFADELKLWQEAAAHLPQPTVLGATRIHYNVGQHSLRSRQIDKALQEFDWVVHHEPQIFHGYWGRSLARVAQGDWGGAAQDVQTVIRLKPDYGPAYTRLGFIYKKQGRIAESEAAFATAAVHGQTPLVFD